MIVAPRIALDFLLPLKSGIRRSDRLSRLRHSAAATPLLLDDLRSDAGMDWVPQSAWLTELRIDSKPNEGTKLTVTLRLSPIAFEAPV